MGCADVCVSMYYDRSNEFYREATRRARKEYACCECPTPIAAGDLYEYATGKSDGDMFVARTCAECVEIRRAVCCGTWVFGELWESVREQMFPRWFDVKTVDCLARLSESAVAKMRAEYAKYVEDSQ